MENIVDSLSKIGFFFDELILVLNCDNEIIYCNEAAKLHFGFNGRSIQQNFNDYCIRYDIPISNEDGNFLGQNNFNITQCQIVSPNSRGDTVAIDWKISNICENEGVSHILLTGRDISNEFYSNEKIGDLEIQLSSIIEMMAENYWWKDTLGVYKGFNQSLLQKLGVRQQDVIGKTDYDLPWADTADQLVKNDLIVI